MAIVPESWGPTDAGAPSWALGFVEWYCTPPELREIPNASAYADTYGIAKARLSELLRTEWFETRVKAHKEYNGFSWSDLAMVKDVVLKRALAGDVKAATLVLNYAGEVKPEEPAGTGPMTDEQLAHELAARLDIRALPAPSTTEE